jgi:hypothetical protein
VNFSHILKFKILGCDIFQNLQYDRMEDKEQLSFLKQVQIRNRIYIKNPRSKTAFEFGPKLLEVQTRLEKSDKFPKFLI